MTDDTIVVVIRYSAVSSRVAEATEALTQLVDTVVATETECLSITMHQADDDPARILLWEEWTSREAYLGDHMHTPHLRAFIDRASELFVEPPEISFWQRTHEAMPD